MELCCVNCKLSKTHLHNNKAGVPIDMVYRCHLIPGPPWDIKKPLEFVCSYFEERRRR